MSTDCISDSLDKSYNYGPELTEDEADSLRGSLEARVASTCQALKSRHGEAFVGTIFDEHSYMQMPGVAIIGDYLRRKNGLENLHICASLEALREKLSEISRMEGNIRAALVLPDSSEHLPVDSPYYWAMYHHKVAICVEKMGPVVKVAFLDSLSCIIDDFAKSEEPSEPQERTSFGGPAILYAVYSSDLDWKNTQFYYSSIQRQVNGFCCESFALKDAVAFLRDPHFFDKVKAKPVTIKAENQLMELQEITQLPPPFMKGTQKPEVLKSYTDDYPLIETSEGLKPDPLRLQEIEKLQKCIDKHTILISKEKQNHYINHRTHKYFGLILHALETQTTEEIQASIAGHLLLAERKTL